MNINQLIEILQHYDGELMVVVDGYEGGVAELKDVLIAPCLLNVNIQGYYGEHEIADHPWKTKKLSDNYVEVLYLSRNVDMHMEMEG